MIPEANLWATVAPARGHFTVRSTLFGPKRSAQLRSGSDLLTHDDTCCAAHCGSALTRLSPFPGHPAYGGLVRTDLFEQHSQIDM